MPEGSSWTSSSRADYAFATTNGCFPSDAIRMPFGGYPTSSQATLFPLGRLACFRQRGEGGFPALVSLPRQTAPIWVVFHDREQPWPHEEPPQRFQDDATVLPDAEASEQRPASCMEALNQLLDAFLSIICLVRRSTGEGSGATWVRGCNSVHDEGPPVEVVDIAPVFGIKTSDVPENRSIFGVTDAQ